MSTRPSAGSTTGPTTGSTTGKVLPGTLAERKRSGEPIVMVTAYDHPSARVVEAAGADIALVGDSAAMTVLGYDSTLPITMDELLMLAAAVRRGLENPLLVGDLPFGSYEASDQLAVESAQRFVKQAGCDAVKLERGGTSADRARAIVAAGIPVMGHVGLTPQSASALGGYRAQGRTAEQAVRLDREARELEAAGCFAIVFEAVPSQVTELITARLSVPTIGIGSGPSTDGQVLVFHDLLGIHPGPAARFVRKYADVGEAMLTGVRGFVDDVRSGGYPAPEHGYSVPADELSRFRELLEETHDYH